MRVDFLDMADAVQAELSSLSSNRQMSGSFKTRERMRIVNRWLLHVYNLGREDMKKELTQESENL